VVNKWCSRRALGEMVYTVEQFFVSVVISRSKGKGDGCDLRNIDQL
jgi:hypothetical protein